MTEEYRPKQYLITPPREQQLAVYDLLAEFQPHKFERISYLSVTVRSKEQETSLLETLTNIPEVTYREALKRSIDGGQKHDKP